MKVEERVYRAGYDLSDFRLPTELAIPGFVPLSHIGSLIFLAGQVPFCKGTLVHTGKLGGNLTVAQGTNAARICVLNALASLQSYLGDLDRIRQIIRLTGYIASADGFADQHTVLNGASEALMDFFGENGRHPRMAIGVASLALKIPVELDIIVDVV